ncbi:MAG: hypothetical protein WC048_11860 [Rhizobium sp.]
MDHFRQGMLLVSGKSSNAEEFPMMLADRVAAGYRTDNFSDPKVILSATNKIPARSAKLTGVTPRSIMPDKTRIAGGACHV